jgi:putative endonuclease
MHGGWVYIMTNRRHGVLYVGVTANLSRRAYEHRMGLIGGFTKRYGLTRLVFAERHEAIIAAIAREETVKRWRRAWKITLIEQYNLEWADLFDQL